MTEIDPARPAPQEGAASERAEWQGLKGEVEGLADVAAERGRGLLDAARSQAESFVEQRKTEAAQSVQGIARSLRDSGQGFENQPNVRAFFDGAAEGLEQLGGSIESRSLSDIYREAESFARRAPVAVAIGTFVAGFAAARFIKASGERRSETAPPAPKPDLKTDS